jgi:hypothetical protein
MLATQRKYAENTVIMKESASPVKQQEKGWICNCSSRILGILHVIVHSLFSEMFKFPNQHLSQ